MRATIKKTLRNAVLFGVLVCGVYNFLFSHMSVTLTMNNNTQRQLSLLKKETTGKNHTFNILYWTRFTSIKSTNNWFGLGREPFKTCEYQNCILTNDSSQYNYSDAILFYLRHVTTLPTHRFPWQTWIMRTDESPYREKDYTPYNGIFNATWTYHSKSDIYSHTYYQKFSRIDKPPELEDIVVAGKRAVAWFVGECFVQSRRHNLVKALQKYMDIDVYGRCGALKCGGGIDYDCDKMLSRNYKFYLSFENSLCEEYVTEKLWRAYHNNVVPIVMGASNYSAYLPEHSYIDVGQFSSVKELADYLNLLHTNDTLYKEYFEWRKHYEITYYEPDACALCKYMNHNVNVTKVHNHLNVFWNERTDCFSPQVYYKNLFRDLSLKLPDIYTSTIFT